jgi:hypothetical protein
MDVQPCELQCDPHFSPHWWTADPARLAGLKSAHRKIGIEHAELASFWLQCTSNSRYDYALA